MAAEASLQRPSVVVPAFLQKEPTRHGPLWAMPRLHSRRARDRLALDIVDTVIAGSNPPAWLFTSKSGHVVRKSEEKTTAPRIQAMLRSFSTEAHPLAAPVPPVAVPPASAASGDDIPAHEDSDAKRAEAPAEPAGGQGYGFVEYSSDGEPRLVSAAEAATRMSGGIPLCDMFQPYIEPRYIRHAHANFRHRWSLYIGTLGGKPVSHYFQLHAAAAGPEGGSRELTATMSRHRVINERMEVMSRLARSYIMAHAGVRVTEMVVDYHLDATERLRLAVVSSVAVVPNEAPSAEQLARNKARSPAAGLGSTPSLPSAEWEQLALHLGADQAHAVSLAREILGDGEASKLAHRLVETGAGADSAGAEGGITALLKERAARGRPSATAGHGASSSSLPRAGAGRRGSGRRRRKRGSRADGSSSSSSSGYDSRGSAPERAPVGGGTALSLADLAELRSFKRPPPGVELAVSASLLLLVGRTAQWERARRILPASGTGGGLLGSMARFDPDRCPADRIDALLPLVRGVAFRFEAMAPVSMAAARLAAWVTTTVTAIDEARRTGVRPSELLAAPRTTDAMAASVASSRWADETSGHDGPGWDTGGAPRRQAGPRDLAPPMPGHSPSLASVFDDDDVEEEEEEEGTGAPAVVPAELLKPVPRRAAHGSAQPKPSGGAPPPSASRGAGQERARRLSSAESARRLARDEARPGPAVDGAARRDASAPLLAQPVSVPARLPGIATLRRGARVPSLAPSDPRPADTGDWASEPGPGGGLVVETDRHEYACRRPGLAGATLSWVLVGEADTSRRAHDFVVLPDLFTTGDALLPLVRPVAMRTRSRFLVVNLPGQAHTRYPGDEPPSAPRPSSAGPAPAPPALTPSFHAECLDELLEHLDAAGAVEVTARRAGRTAQAAEKAKSSGVRPGGVYVSGAVPGARPRRWHLAGFGSGGATALAFAVAHAGGPYAGSLASVLTLNGFARADSQLAAVMHASENVFACFPPDRQDLADSYFGRFLFSDAYLRQVTPEGAQARLAATHNPISPEGRAALCRGVLAAEDLRRRLAAAPVPIVAVQSTDGVLVATTAAEEVTAGRDVRHVTAPDVSAPAGGASRGVALPRATPQLLPPGVMPALAHTLASPGGRALVVWVSAGHEVRLEAPLGLLQLLTVLADPEAAAEEAEARQDEVAIAAATGGQAGAAAAAAASVAPLGRSAFDIDWEEERAGASGVVHPLKMLNPSQRRDKKEQRKMRMALSGATGDAAAGGAHGADERSEAAAAAAAATAGSAPPRARAHAPRSSPSSSPAAARASATGRVMGATVQRGAHHDLAVTTGIWNQGAVLAEGADPMAGTAPAGSGSSAVDRLRAEQASRMERWRREEDERFDTLKADLWRKAREREEQAGRARGEAVQAAEEAEERAAGAEQRARRAADAIPVTDEAIERGRAAVARPASPAGTGGPRMTAKEDVRSLLAKSTLHSSLRPEPATGTRPIGTLTEQGYAAVQAEMDEAKREEEEAAETAKRRAEEAAFVARLPLLNASALDIQRSWRGFLGRRETKQRRTLSRMKTAEKRAAELIQSHIRGKFGRLRAHKERMRKLRILFLGESASQIQRAYRRYMTLCAATELRFQGAARDVQRVFRGHMGRRYAGAVRGSRDRAREQNAAAVRVQSCWKRHRVMQGYREIQILRVAATTIQRTFRGYVDRRFAADLREWEEAESGPRRLAVGVRIMTRESSALASFQRDAAETTRAHGRCLNRAQHARKRLRRVEKELRRVRASKAADEAQAERLDDMSRDRHALEAALKEMDEEVSAEKRETMGGLDVRLLQQMAVMHGVRLPAGLGRVAAEAASETSSDGESDDTTARVRRARRVRRRRQRHKAQAAEADQVERLRIARRAQARAEERESTLLAVRVRRGELGKSILEAERREKALQDHAASLQSTAAALEDQADDLAGRSRLRQEQLSRLVTRITTLSDRQTSEFNAIQDRTQQRRSAEIMTRMAQLADMAQRSMRAEANRRADDFAAASERAVTAFIRPAAAAFLTSVTTIGAVEDGTVASHARALEFITGAAAENAASGGRHAALGGLTGAQAAVAGRDAALTALGFGIPGAEGMTGRRDRRGRLLDAAAAGTAVQDREARAAEEEAKEVKRQRSALPPISDRASATVGRGGLLLLNGGASSVGGTGAGSMVSRPGRRKKRRYRGKYEFGSVPDGASGGLRGASTSVMSTATGAWSDEDSDADTVLGKKEAAAALDRKQARLAARKKWKKTRERRAGALEGVTAEAKARAEAAAAAGDSAGSDEDFAAGVVVDEMEDARVEAGRLALEAGARPLDETTGRSRALRRALALGASTQLDLAATTGLTHQERTRDVEFSFKHGAHRTKRMPKGSAARFLPASMREYAAPDLGEQLRRHEEEVRQAALAEEAAERRRRRKARRLKRLADSDDDSESTDDGKTLSDKRGGSLASAIERARADAFGEELPADVRKWSVADVMKWFQGLGFAQYGAHAKEAELDGPLLLEIRPEDLRDVVGIDRPEHLRRVNRYRQRLGEPPPNHVGTLLQLKRWRMGRFKGAEDAERPVDAEAQAMELSDGRPLRAGVALAQAKLGRYQRVEEALARGLDADATTEDGLERTGVHVAALTCDRRMAAIFLRYGAFVSHRDTFGNTPLHYAYALDPSGDMVAFLLDRGADDRATNKLGCRPEDKRLGPGAEAGAVVRPRHLRDAEAAHAASARGVTRR